MVHFIEKIPTIHEPDSQRVVHVHKLFIDAQIQDASHGVQRVEKALLRLALTEKPLTAK